MTARRGGGWQDTNLATAARKAKAAARREDYWELTHDFGLTPRQAAARLRVTLRTVRNYEAHFRALDGTEAGQ